VVYNNWMVQPGWVRDQANNAIVTVDKVVDHIDHICQLAGDNAHVTVGSDLDGGFGREETPRDIDTVADLQNLNGLLFKRGYGEAAILHGNWLRFLR